MVSPSLVLIALVAAYPILYAIWLSLHQYSVRDGGSLALAGPSGSDNYTTRPRQDATFWTAMRTTLIFTVVERDPRAAASASPWRWPCTRRSRARALLRTVVLVPWAMLTVVTAIMWQTIFESPQGFVNQIHRLATPSGWARSRRR